MIKVKSNATYVFRCSGVNILPGINYVDNDKFFDHPSVKGRIENGTFKVDEPLKKKAQEKASVKGKEISLADYFTTLNVRDLSAEIKQIFSIELLELIFESDNRATIKKACQDQLKKLVEGSEDVQ